MLPRHVLLFSAALMFRTCVTPRSVVMLYRWDLPQAAHDGKLGFLKTDFRVLFTRAVKLLAFFFCYGLCSTAYPYFCEDTTPLVVLHHCELTRAVHGDHLCFHTE